MNDGRIKVTVDMLVYNHEKYLKQAIDSVLMQVGDFDIEILIHDDASTDASQDIIREYQNCYPEMIKPILQRENQLSQGVSTLGRFQIPRYSGDYVAYCEGDDYWTDSEKLKKQIGFLESHPDFVAVGHNVKFVDENGNDYKGSVPKRWTAMSDYEFTLRDTDQHQMFGQTASRVYRNFWKERPEIISWFNEATHPHGDTKMSLIASCLGRIWVMKDVMSAYRKVTTGSSWSARVKEKNQAERKMQSLNELIELASKMGKTLHFRNEYEKTLFMAMQKFLQNPTEENRKVLSFVWEMYPYKHSVPWSLTKRSVFFLFNH